MQGQMTIFDFRTEQFKELAERIAKRMNDNYDLNFVKVVNDGYYKLFVSEKTNHRLVIDGSNNSLGFGIDGLFLKCQGYDDIERRYREWMDNTQYGE